MNATFKDLISVGGLLVAIVSGSIWVGTLSARLSTVEA